MTQGMSISHPKPLRRPLAAAGRTVLADARGLESTSWRGWQVFSYQALLALARHAPDLALHVLIRGRAAPDHLQALADAPGVVIHPSGGKYASHVAVPCLAFRIRCKAYWRLFNEYRPLPLPTGTRNLITIHDLQRVVLHDDGSERARPAVPASWQIARRQVDHVIAVSNAMRKQISALLCWDEARISVVPNGFEDPPPEPVMPPQSVGSHPFLLAVNVGNYYKNWRQVIAAFQRVANDPETNRVRLVIAGELHGEEAALRSVVSSTPELRSRLVFTGRITDQELQALYARCLSLVTLSRYEGFGRPVVEAMAFGAPVIASDIAPHREVSDGQATYVPVDDVEAAAAAMKAAAEGRGPSVARDFRGYPSRYRWAVVAQQLGDVLRSQCAARSGRAAPTTLRQT